MKKTRYLITGGTGFIGSAIVKSLVKQNNFVRVFDNESRGSINRLEDVGENIDFVKGDIREANDVNKATRGIDKIIHLAYINGTKYFYEKPDLVLSVGVKGMINVLDAAEKNGVSELFLASSSEVYQKPQKIPTPEEIPYSIPSLFNPRYSYGGGKIISELLSYHIGRKFLKKVVIFRPHNVYGPDMGEEHVIPEILRQIIRKKATKKEKIDIKVQGTGKETRAFIYIDDFSDALILLDKKGKDGEIYNIGTNDEITIYNLVKTMGIVTKTKINVIPSKRKDGSVLRRCPDIGKIKKLGFSPKVSISDGLEKTFLWYNTNN